MADIYMIGTHGDPLGALRGWLAAVWRQADLRGVYAPVNGGASPHTRHELVGEPGALARVNPFRPLMTHSAARGLPDLARQASDGPIAVLLRPCEMRAWVEMVKRDGFLADKLLTICVDCLATLPVEEFAWRARRLEGRGAVDGSAALSDATASGAVTHDAGPAEDNRPADAPAAEALRYAPRGGIVPYRYRSACQICVSPEARDADLNVGVLGLPVREALLVGAGSDRAAALLAKGKLTDGLAPDAWVARRREMLAHIDERHERARRRIVSGLPAGMPTTADGAARLLQSCGGCPTCRDVCPICAVEAPEPLRDGSFAERHVARWLISCDGCGMCEQWCPRQLPLAAVFGRIRDGLARPTGYVPGRSMSDPLPL